MKARLVVPVSVLSIVAALALAACGSSGSSGEEAKVEEAIETAATGTNPSKCTEVETLNFVEQTTRASGKAAVKQCEREAGEEEQAKSAEVSNISVEGSKATAEVKLDGTIYSGQTLEIGLVKEGEQWKVNELTGFAGFDGEEFVESLKEQFANEPAKERIPAALEGCIVKNVEEMPQGELEELLLSRSPESFNKLAAGCSK